MFVDKEKDCLKDYISGKLGITGGKPLLAFFKSTFDPKKPTTPEKNLVTFTHSQIDCVLSLIYHNNPDI